MATLVDMCRTIADGADAAWDDAQTNETRRFQSILSAASDALIEAANEIDRLQAAAGPGNSSVPGHLVPPQ